MTREEMIATYNAMTAAEGYILGFVRAHRLYYVELRHLPENALKLERASSKRGGTLKIRIRVNADTCWDYIESGAAVLLGEETLLTDRLYNKGETFERIITETLTGEAWVKDSVPFTKAGDITYRGKQIQVKFDGAELTNERTLRNLMAG